MSDRRRRRRRKKMNKIDIFAFGFLGLVKGSRNLLSRFSNRIAKRSSLYAFRTPLLCFSESCSYTLCTGGHFKPAPSLELLPYFLIRFYQLCNIFQEMQVWWIKHRMDGCHARRMKKGKSVVMVLSVTLRRRKSGTLGRRSSAATKITLHSIPMKVIKETTYCTYS